MKYLKMLGLGLSLAICCTQLSAQNYRINEPDYNKPRLFDALPQDITANTSQLSTLLNYQLGQEVNITLAPGFEFKGHVVSTSNIYESSIKSVVISSNNYNGARLTFTKMTEGERVSYSGRIISFTHGDLFELINRDNQYYFIKKKFYDLVNE